MTDERPGGPWRCSLDLLAEQPTETEWLIGGIIPAASVVLLSGREGHMKTWLGMDWAFAVAEGRPWLGHECAAGAVLWVDGEMPRNAFVDRLRAYGGSRNLYVWRWQEEGFPSQLEDRLLLQAAQEHALIIIDSLRRFMKDQRGRELDENDASAMAMITAQLRQLTKSGASVLVLHHGVKDHERRGYRGSSELGAGVDVVMHVVKVCDECGEGLSLTVHKTRYTEEASMAFRVHRTDTRPEFRATGASPVMTAVANSVSDLETLRSMIEHLIKTNGREPNQSEIVHHAKEQGLASRNTILSWLRQGEDAKLWVSKLDGCSRVYGLPPVAPPCSDSDQDSRACPTDQIACRDMTDQDGMGREEMANAVLVTGESVHLSSCPASGVSGGLDKSPTEPLHTGRSNPVVHQSRG